MKTFIAIFMALVYGPLAAQQLNVVPIQNFVELIESGGYAQYNATDQPGMIKSFAPLDLGESRYLADPVGSLQFGIAVLVDMIVHDLNVFNSYWNTQPNPSLIDWRSSNADVPQITAAYITNNIYNAEQLRKLQAPELDASSLPAGLALLFGALAVAAYRKDT
jgi:hypothetical protein